MDEMKRQPESGKSRFRLPYGARAMRPIRFSGCLLCFISRQP